MWVLVAYNDYGDYEGCSEPSVIAFDENSEKLWGYLEKNRERIISENKYDLYETCVTFSVQKAYGI